MEKAYAPTVESSAGHWIRAWLPVALHMGLIYYFSSLPYPEERLPKFLFEALGDKLLHAIEYSVLAVLCFRAFRRAAGRYAANSAVVLAITVASLYGATDEVHQAFVPFRTSAWSDWLADTAGAAIGAIAARWFMERGVKDTNS
jgi:VanZ family protein